jgi:CubicO group peptidase (beta-lactamase class C family)
MFARFCVPPVLVIALVAAGCAASAEETHRQPIPRSPVWEQAAPESVGLDPRVIAEADRLARTKLRGVTSLLVARHGRLVVERYYAGLQASDQVPVFSITKTFVSALVGIALADGRLRSIDERLVAVLPETQSPITLRQLLTMTAGFGRSLSFQLTDPTALANRPLVNEPGTTFNYDSGSSDLLAAVLKRATGMTAAQYAQRRLFAPLGIRGARWPSSRGGSGLILRPRDLLAFGQMYLDSGKWRGRRVVSSAWVRASTRTQVHVPREQALSEGYGYNWWIGDRAPRLFAAHGYLGQALVVFPQLDTVVVVTSSGEVVDSGLALARVIARAPQA